MAEHADSSESDIAVVGMACRFPGAPNLDVFWKNLVEGRDTATTFTDQQLLAAGVPLEVVSDPNYVKRAQLIDRLEMFDADFFGVTGDEAEILDPQHRHFLECAVEALEHAGHDPARYAHAIGVFASAGMNTYLLNNLIERYQSGSLLSHYRLMLGNDKDFLATRVSYKLNLRGPSIAVNTACSSSLVAVHLACLSLLSGECRMALAGAAHIKVPQTAGYTYQEGMILSPDGRCRAFDRAAQGTIPGNGVGLVVLKRLADALVDQDTIYAVIRGSAVNNDGSSKAGYTAPSVQGQAAVIGEAYQVAGCSPARVSYVEAHGTGTVLGDPVELNALTQAFSLSTPQKGSCAIGSVKTNIGHLDAGAGIAGLLKTCLMLWHKRLVPSLHFEAPNPAIDFADSPFYVNTQAIDWPRTEGPRLAGVSSFGIGGTNAHVVVQEAHGRAESSASAVSQLLVISARSPAALDAATRNLGRHLGRQQELSLGDVAFTLGVGRRVHAYRRALVCRDVKDAALVFALGDPKRMLTGHASEANSGTIFVLHEPSLEAKAELIALCNELPALRLHVSQCLLELGLNDSAQGAALAELDATTCRFVASYALGLWYRSLGVTPNAIVGVGTAQIAAACIAGAITPGDALALARGHRYANAALLTTPAITLLSNVTGKPLGAAELATLQDRFGASQRGVEMDLGVAEFAAGQTVLRVTTAGGSAAVLQTLAGLWIAGSALEFVELFGDEPRRRIALPTYPFEHKRYWVEVAPRGSVVPVRPEVSLSERLTQVPAAERMSTLVEFLRATLLGVLGPNSMPPGVDQSLYELGIDSLMLIDIAEKFSKVWGHSVTASSFVEYPNIGKLAVHLLQSIGLHAAPSSDDRPTSRRAQRGRAHE